MAQELNKVVFTGWVVRDSELEGGIIGWDWSMDAKSPRWSEFIAHSGITVTKLDTMETYSGYGDDAGEA